MARMFWLLVGALVAIWLVLQLGVLPAPAAKLAESILGLACSMACPISLLMLFYAPGLFQELTSGITHTWQRVLTQRRDVEDLTRKIAHLDKAHHMAQLGNHYLRQGRLKLAAPWFEKALEKEPEMLDARYRLALCRFDEGDHRQAVELLEAVHEEKPRHDYGLAQLRLAQSHHCLGSLDRAEEVYQSLIQYYPGHPEGSYYYALLKAEQGDLERARELMREMIVSVRLSPGFQRRRNRHWLLKARWWLWRN